LNAVFHFLQPVNGAVKIRRVLFSILGLLEKGVVSQPLGDIRAMINDGLCGR